MTLDSISKDPIKNLALGNSIPKEYDFFKYKQEGFKEPLTEKENLLLLIMAYRFTLFDLGYVLDLEPNNKDIYTYYSQIKTDLKKLTDYYEQSFGSLCHTSDIITSSYSYVMPPFVGER